MQKVYPDVDVHACKTKFKGLRKGYEALVWCEIHQEKAAAEGNGRFRGESYTEFFERQTGTLIIVVVSPSSHTVCFFSQTQGLEVTEQDRGSD